MKDFEPILPNKKLSSKFIFQYGLFDFSHLTIATAEDDECKVEINELAEPGKD